LSSSSMSMRRKIVPTVARNLFVAGVFLLLYVPLFILAAFSFNDSIVVALPFRGFSLGWYSAALDDVDVRAAVRNSLVVALAVVPLSVIVGTLAAFGLTRFRFRLKSAVGALVGAPLVVSWLVMGVGALLLFSTLSIPLSLRTIGAVHVMASFPLVTAIVSARLIRFDRSIEEAALDLGALPRTVLARLVLPQLVPALAASALLVFAWSFNNFTLSFFTAGFETTFPIWVYSNVEHARALPIVNAVSTFVLGVQVVLTFVVWYLLRLRPGGRAMGAPIVPGLPSPTRADG
jgi:spermidine/putrescine transport system permease protein